MSLSACAQPKSNCEPILWEACCVGREVRAGPVERANYAPCAVCVITSMRRCLHHRLRARDTRTGRAWGTACKAEEQISVVLETTGRPMLSRKWLPAR
jgi:hypothetical protein